MLVACCLSECGGTGRGTDVVKIDVQCYKDRCVAFRSTVLAAFKHLLIYLGLECGGD